MTSKKAKQLQLLPKQSLSYGGDLQTTRKGRTGPRPLSTKSTIHLTLRSSKAKGSWSFLRFRQDIQNIFSKFAKINQIQIISMANVGNHIHLHIKLSNQRSYKPFIRAVTAAISMKVTGRSRWNQKEKIKFWDRRPFTRIVIGYKAMLTLKDYIYLNQLEGMGFTRKVAKVIIREESWFKSYPSTA